MEGVLKVNYTRREAAFAIGVSVSVLDTLLHRPNHPIPHFCPGQRKVLIPRAALENWVKEESAVADAEIR